jgi:hypothetical protein
VELGALVAQSVAVRLALLAKAGSYQAELVSSAWKTVPRAPVQQAARIVMLATLITEWASRGPSVLLPVLLTCQLTATDSICTSVTIVVRTVRPVAGPQVSPVAAVTRL